jgi:hypothetical protein
MGRPRKEIDKTQFEKLCSLQCTLLEICAWFSITDKTLDSWCKRTYGKSFSEVFTEKRGIGKISLRRNQWKLAEKNAAMAIFLGKQYLGQTDQGEVIKVNDDIEEDALSKSLRELAERLDDDV